MSDLDDAKSARNDCTKALGDVVRQLAFAGIAIVWILRSEPLKTGLTFTSEFFWPLLFFSLSLSFDLLQYIWSSALWDTVVMIWSRRKSPKSENDPIPKWVEYLNAPTRIFLWAKAMSLVMGYILLISILIYRINHSDTSPKNSTEVEARQATPSTR